MAQKKKEVMNAELKDASLMDILSSEGTKVFTMNRLIDFSYSTGIVVMDYAYGYEILIKENGEVVGKRKCLGLQAGSFNVVTGPTQSYKSTLAEYIIANIAYKYDGNVVHYDIENRLVVSRLKQITKLPDDWFEGDNPRYVLKGGAIGYDTLQNDITEIYMNKMAHKDILTKDTGVRDANNKPIYLMPPTVVFADSLTDIIAKEYDANNKKIMDGVEELRSNTYGMQAAKTLRGVLTDILPMLKEANIILIVISHQSDNVSMNAFAPPKKQFQYGSASTKISGGKAVEYNASTVSNFTAEIKEDSRYHVNTDGFEGNTIVFEPIKSSTNQSGNEKTGLGFKIIINKQGENVGCDNIRTLIKLLDQKGRLKGNRAGWYVLDDHGNPITEKFTWKKVHDEFQANPEMFKTFMTTAKEELEKLVAPAVDNSGKIRPFDVDSILNDLG